MPGPTPGPLSTQVGEAVCLQSWYHLSWYQLTHDCHKMRDETRYMGVGVVTLTEILLVQVRHLSPHSKIDRPDPGSDGKKKKKFISINTDCCYGFTTCISTGWCIEKDGLSPLGERTLKAKNTLALLETIWLPLQILVAVLSGLQWLLTVFLLSSFLALKSVPVY